MDLRQVEFFLAVVREGTFTRAAAASLVSQPGLSSSIRALERELGAILFERTARGATLTAAGQTFFPRARRMMDDAVAARRELLSSPAVEQRRVSIGAEQCLGMLVDLIDLISAFGANNPGVPLALSHASSGALLQSVHHGEIDLALVGTSIKHPVPAHSVELARDEFVLLTAPDHPLAGHREVTVAHLERHAFADLGQGWSARTVVDEAFAALGRRRRVEFTLGDVHSLLDIVRTGLAVAIVPTVVAAKPQAAGLSSIRLVGLNVRWHVSLVSARHTSAVARLFAEQLLPVQTVEHAQRELQDLHQRGPLTA